MIEREKKVNNDPRHIRERRECSDNNLDTLAYRINLFQIKSINISSMMDIGSQEGQFANVVFKDLDIKEVSCIDSASVVVKNGRKRFPHLKWYEGDGATFNFPEKYDLMTWLNGYFSLKSKERLPFLKRARSFLNNPGYLLISFGDVNFEALGVSSKTLIKEINQVFDVLNIIKEYEYKPLNQISNFKGHRTYGRWYTSILARGKE